MKQRDSRFEIIRIIAMVLIVCYNYGLYGNWQWNPATTMQLQFYRPWGFVGVDLFAMITGYFLSTRNFSLKDIWQHVKKLWLKTLIYSWLITILASLFHWGQFLPQDYLFAILPVIFNEYWFITSYLFLLFLVPLLNWLVKNTTQKNLLIYLGVIGLVTEVMPFIKNNGTPNSPLGSAWGTTILLVPYLIAAYFRKYGLQVPGILGWLLLLIGSGFEYLSFFILSQLITGWDMATWTYGLLPLVAATGIFMIFLQRKTFHNRLINWLVAGVVGTYLITEHPLLRIYFWQKLLNVGQYQWVLWKFILLGLLIALISVLAGTLIDHVVSRIVKLFN